MDDERPKTPFGPGHADYFDELVEATEEAWPNPREEGTWEGMSRDDPEGAPR